MDLGFSKDQGFSKVQSIESYICLIRRKLNGAGERPYIRTVRSAGYVFETG